MSNYDENITRENNEQPVNEPVQNAAPETAASQEAYASAETVYTPPVQEPEYSPWPVQQSQPVYSEPVHYAPPMYNERQPTRNEQPMYSEPQPYREAPEQSRQIPGIYYAAQNAPTKKQKKKGFRIFAAILAVILVGGIATFFAFYEVQLGDGVLFSIVRRYDVMETNPLTPNEGDPTLPVDSMEADPAPTGGIDSDETPRLQIHNAPVTTTTPLSERVSGELTIGEIYEKCVDSTVGIIASSESSYYGFVQSSGTGIIMTSDGYIITNCHVIQNATNVSVVLMNGEEYKAKVIGADSRSDIAVIKIDAKGLKAAEFGNSDELKVGDPVVAIGNPLGLELMGTTTNGIVSAINRDVLVDERIMTLIQTNAAINSGNSGGPLINKFGQVIGINTLKMNDYATNVEGLGFAIPTKTVQEIVDQLMGYGYVKGYPSIGIVGQNVTEYMRQRYQVPLGVAVTSVSENSNAYKAGLAVADIITAVDGEPIYSTTELNIAKEKRVAGDNFTIMVWRDGKYIEITFKLNDETEIDQSSFITGSQP